MQTPSTLPHALPEFLWFVFATILANSALGTVVVGILTAILNRKKPFVVLAEIHESEARTAKSFAEARNLDLQTNIQAGDAVPRMVQRLTFAQLANVELRDENERLATENEVYEKQMRKAKALLKLHNIDFDSAG